MNSLCSVNKDPMSKNSNSNELSHIDTKKCSILNVKNILI